ncbi:MAG: uracil-DNA glycosylase [Campylobacterota bacterium]|nr:uracil-DNA glycosylase [Campylobacterota bacterium]
MKNLHNALLLKQLYQLRQLGYRYTELSLPQHKESDLQLPSSMEALKKQALNCHLCELSKSRTHVVFGEGDENAEILFVGEGPGATEDSTGHPFVGRAGEVLTNMIEKVLLIPRSEVYITNIVKCRPPDNRVPTATEAHTCLPYLHKQIESIKPKLIVTLGATAYHYLTGDESKITQIRGTIQKRDHYTIIPTFHPSYLLRNPSAKKEAFIDMKLIKSLMIP